jgi:hypothetical protein
MEFPMMPGYPGQGAPMPPPPPGLLGAQIDPQRQGLLAAAFQGLQASGPSRMPMSLGQTVGQAGQAGMEAMRQGTNDQLRQQQFGMQQQMQQMQYAQHAQAMKKAQEQERAMSDFAATLPPEKQAIFRANPTAFIQEMNKRYTVGNNLVGGGGETVFTAPDKPTLQEVPVDGQPGVTRKVWLTPGQTDGAQVGGMKQPEILNPAVQAAKVSIAKAGKPDINTQVTLKQEGEEAKTVGKFFGDSYADIQKAGFNAPSRIARMDRLNQLLDGVNTGKLTPAGTELAAYAESLGLKIDKNLGNKQAAQALANEMALELRNPAGGAGMPGAMSDADREFLKSMTPGLSTSPDGRKQITETGKKIAKRDQDVAKMAREYRQKNGSIDEGFYEKLREFSDKNPLFGGGPPGFKVLGVEGSK